jgi:hypothetical protein
VKVGGRLVRGLRARAGTVDARSGRMVRSPSYFRLQLPAASGQCERHPKERQADFREMSRRKGASMEGEEKVRREADGCVTRKKPPASTTQTGEHRLEPSACRPEQGGEGAEGGSRSCFLLESAPVERLAALVLLEDRVLWLDTPAQGTAAADGRQLRARRPRVGRRRVSGRLGTCAAEELEAQAVDLKQGSRTGDVSLRAAKLTRIGRYAQRAAWGQARR